MAGDGGRLRSAVEVALVLLLAVQAARLAWLLLPPVPLGEPAPPAARPPAADAARLAIDAFHPVRGAATASAGATGLKLFAVRPDAEAGSAIIAGSDGRQRSHAVGDEVAPGLLLAAVHADHVELDGGGGRSVLRFESRPALAGPRTAAPAPGPAAPPPAMGETGGTPTVDPEALLAQAGLRPVEAGGRVSGYTVIPRGDGAVLRQAGLQAGDVLLSVNGQELTPERYAELAGELAGSSSITLTYRRDGQIRSATLQAKTP